ncbi:hypothetical protein LCGC14_2817110, partial [marine sediment metagenome]
TKALNDNQDFLYNGYRIRDNKRKGKKNNNWIN